MEKRITGRTGMFCLIGTPVGHSGSPAMYNYSFAQTGLDYAYLAYDVPLEKTEEAVNALKVLGCKGFNVTMPCKTRVAELVDELSDAAKLIGACNTVVVKDGKLYGTPAVIDKDFASAKLAELVHADALVILTAVDRVCINWGKPNQQSLDEMSVADAEKYCEEGHFAPGSMLPKVKAAISFAKTGGTAIIASLENAGKAVKGESGTVVHQ